MLNVLLVTEKINKFTEHRLTTYGAQVQGKLETIMIQKIIVFR
jgi:hypothetical protein